MLVKPISASPSDGYSDAEVAQMARLFANMFKPQRLNFGGVCVYCAVRWCEDAGCVAQHERTIWLPCDACDGFGSLVGCRECMHGVVEGAPAAALEQAGRVLPVEPAAETYRVALDGGRR